MTEILTKRLEWSPSDEGGPLGRHVKHDPRSRAFAVEAAPLSTLVSVRHKRRVAPFDQGQVGSCVGNTAAGVLSTAPFKHRYTEKTALKFYSAATREDDDATQQYPPNDTGSSGLAAGNALLKLKLISSFDHAFGLDAALTALQTSAVMVGIEWLDGCDRPNADGLIGYMGSARGGHEIECDEVDVQKRLVGFTNSWGTGWGVQGRFFMTWDDFGKALDAQGDVTVLRP